MRKGDFPGAIEATSDFESADALAVEIRRLAGWLNARFAEMERLMEVSQQVAQGLILDDVLQRTYEAFKPLIPYDRIGCALLSDDGASLTAYWARTEYEQPQLTKGYSAPIKGSSLEAILRTRRPRIINDLEAYAREHPDSKSTKVVLAEGVRSSLTCPLMTEGRAIGFLFFSSCEKNTYRNLHQDLFLRIAGHLSTLVERSRLYQRVWKLNEDLQLAHRRIADQAAHDPLTGVLNHGAILQQLELAIADPSSGRLPAVLMLDLDHFKSVNDRFGHLAGDEALRRIARTIQGCLRHTDYLGRYGGEEFLILLADADSRIARRVAERIRGAVEVEPIPFDEETLSVTVSIGVGLPARRPETDPSALIGLADRALYEAKRTGRNRVCVQEDLPLRTADAA